VECREDALPQWSSIQRRKPGDQAIRRSPLSGLLSRGDARPLPPPQGRSNQECHMSDDEQTPEPIGWIVTDPDGNVVDSGGVSIAQADGKLAGLIAEAAANEEGEQE